jgi:hypothetical protein
MKTPCAEKEVTEAEMLQALRRSDEQALEGLTIRENVAQLDVGMRVDLVYAHGMFVNPTLKQKQALSRTFGACRFVYNWGLRLRTDAWYECQQSIGYHATSAMLADLKQQPETAWPNEISFVPTQHIGDANSEVLFLQRIVDLLDSHSTDCIVSLPAAAEYSRQ